MYMSQETYRNLDLDYVFDNLTVYTPYGKKNKKAMRAFKVEEKEKLIQELDRVETVVNLIERQRYTFIEIRNNFKHIKDLSTTFKRVREDEVLSITELFELKLFLIILKKLEEALNKLKWKTPEDLKVTSIPYLENLFDPQNNGLTTFYIYDEYSEKLEEIRRNIRDIEGAISKRKKEIQKNVEDELGIRLRPSGEIIVKKTDEELIERLRNNKNLIYSMETYMNITFKIKASWDIDKLNTKLEGLKGMEEDEEIQVRKFLSKEVKRFLNQIEKNIKAIGKLDLLIAKGYHAIGFRGTRPEINSSGRVYILEGRHIKIENNLKKEGREFTPITLDISKGVTCITGANMGGKTVSLKIIGMLTAMAQFGLFVPAKAMIVSLNKYIFFSMGDLQSSDMGLSTFGGEIVKIREAIKASHGEGMILIDELARGTNPKEGFAISKAIINYLENKKAITVITTHFDGLGSGSNIKHLQVRGLSLENFKKISKELEKGEDGIQEIHKYMDYRLQEVSNIHEVPKDAINISRLMGLDEEILKDAERILEGRK